MSTQTTPPSKPLTCRIRPNQAPMTLAEYQQHGGYQGLRNALKMAPAEVVTLVKDAGLRGRGGAGFPTGLKWSLVPQGEGTPKQRYIVANGDEMEPGTFKDRLLLEGDPLQFIEGITIGGYAIGATVGYVFLRAEYGLAAERLRAAIAECYAAGLLGKNILGSGVDFDLHLHTSAGRYICGEETALISSLEGKRAVPRSKPPFPAVAGLFGKPTVVNNIESLCNVPHILHYGMDWYKGLSLCADGGTKLYGASGKLKTPGCWELPMGVTVRELVEQHGGGMRDGLTFRGFLPGGASTDFLGAEHLDTPMTFEAIGKAGSRMGTGLLIVLDDQTDVLGMVHNLQKFFARESCGWCTPCRDGLPWGEKILAGMLEGKGREQDLTVLRQLTKWLGPGRTFCAHAPGAMEPLQSAIKLFSADFERAIGRHPQSKEIGA